MNKEVELNRRLVRQVNVLAGEGWSRPARLTYWNALSRGQLTYRRLNNMFRQAHHIGSSLYMEMLRASGLTARQQLTLILDGHLQSCVDQDGFLQLTSHDYRLNPAMSPLSPFYADFRQLVRDAYIGPLGLRADELGHRLHLFRAYLDLQAINYIRSYCDNLPTTARDFDRLCRFAHDHHIALDFRTAAAYHNRCHGALTYPQNMKVQLCRNSLVRRANPARMIEFIVNIDTGDFVSEWNVYRTRPDGAVDGDPDHYSPAALYQVANAESFNYGIPHGGYFVWPRDRQSHRRLDIDQPRDSRIRARAKHYWKTPRPYTDLVKGPADISAWRRVPVASRSRLYHAFIAVKPENRNWGINRFLLMTPQYRRYHVSH